VFGDHHCVSFSSTHHDSPDTPVHVDQGLGFRVSGLGFRPVRVDEVGQQLAHL